jgi:amino-acid N-acetyltransferase
VPVRRAKITDVKPIQKIVNSYAKRHQLIPRSLNDLYENLRDFFVYEEDGDMAGVCALHVMWEDLAEIRSLVVKRPYQGRGVGKSLVRRALKDARELGIAKVFSLTYVPDYFKLFGFRDIDKSELPHKIWGECVRCPNFPGCDELAVILTL